VPVDKKPAAAHNWAGTTGQEGAVQVYMLAGRAAADRSDKIAVGYSLAVAIG
jgi:hypothetical protein